MTMQFPVAFTKMSGTGNDFIIIDHRQPFLAAEEIPGFVRAVCRRKFSAGADGLILIENSDNADFRWQFFNGDGSRAEMCGNGARCAARFAYEKKIAPAHMRFQTDAGDIEALVSKSGGSLVRIRLTPPENIQLAGKLTVGGREAVVHSINTGVPHAVMLVDDAAVVPVREWGHEVRFHSRFQPAGTNANFVQVLSGNSLKVRTYERGVEDETLACGTGAVASALVAALLALVSPPVTVTTSGGERLTIHFDIDRGREPAGLNLKAGIFLEGPAHIIYEGQLALEALS